MSDLLRQAVRWPLYNPRRLLAVIVAAVVLLILSGSCHHPGKGQAARPAPAPPAATRTAAAAPTATAVPPSAAPSIGDALDVAKAFVAAWASHQPNPAWMNAVTPYATPDFVNALATIDPSRVPATRVTGTVKVTDTGAGPDSTVAAVGTDQGTVSVSLIWDGTAWKVTDVQPGAQAVE